MPPNKILGPAEAEEARAGARDRNDLPVWHPAPPRPTLAHCAVHIMQSCTKCPRWKITLKYILEKYYHKWT